MSCFLAFSPSCCLFHPRLRRSLRATSKKFPKTPHSPQLLTLKSFATRNRLCECCARCAPPGTWNFDQHPLFRPSALGANARVFSPSLLLLNARRQPQPIAEPSLARSPLHNRTPFGHVSISLIKSALTMPHLQGHSSLRSCPYLSIALSLCRIGTSPQPRAPNPWPLLSVQNGSKPAPNPTLANLVPIVHYRFARTAATGSGGRGSRRAARASATGETPATW